MKQWWARQHHACHEAVIIAILAICALTSLLIVNWTSNSVSSVGDLFKSSTSYRIQGPHGSYSLLFKYAIPLIGDDKFNPIGRLKLSEAKLIRDSLQSTKYIRHLGRAQLDQEQQRSYGFNPGITIDAPGQETWLLATGIDGLGYALDKDGNLYQLNRDLAGQLNRSPDAMRSNTIGLPQQLLRIQQDDDWTIGFFRERWWLNMGETSQLADQSICSAWVKVFSETKAISFTPIASQSPKKGIYFEGQNQFGSQVIALFDRGATKDSDDYRIIERHQQIDEHLLKEAFIINIDKNVFNYPSKAFLSKTLIPFDINTAHLIQINNLVIAKKQNVWYIDKNTPAHTEKINKLIVKLSRLPSTEQNPTEHVGSIFTGSLQFLIPKTPQSEAVTKHVLRHEFVDTRILPNIGTDDITGLVIHNDTDAPQFYKRQSDGHWDVDPEIHKSVDNFIQALSSARVQKWDKAFDTKQAWTSTLTVAVNGKHIIIKKTKDHLIGLESTGVQGYLDKDSATDLFGD